MTQAPHPSDYEYKSYGTMRFEVKEGYYSIEDLKKLLAYCEEMKERSDAHLLKSMAVVELRDRIGMMPIEDCRRLFGTKP